MTTINYVRSIREIEYISFDVEKKQEKILNKFCERAYFFNTGKIYNQTYFIYKDFIITSKKQQFSQFKYPEQVLFFEVQL